MSNNDIFELTEEDIQKYVKNFGSLISKVRILPRDGHFGMIAPYVVDPKKTIIALDWDQTITLIKDKHLGPNSIKTIRGADLSKLGFQKYLEDGVQLIVITAQAPSPNVMINLRAEVVKVGLQDIFHVSELDKKRVLDYLHSLGKNSEIDLIQLTRKLSTLIVLHSTRFPADLARISDPSRITFNEERTRVNYKLQILDQTNPAYLDWGGNQILMARKEKVKNDEGKEVDQIISDDYTCPVRTWYEYIERTRHMRVIDENGKYKIERLFLKSVGEGIEAMTDTDLKNMIQNVLQDAKICEDQIKLTIEDPVKITDGEGGQVARLSHLFASRYNKPEAMEQFLKDHPERTHLIFVDDNSDNVWNMFAHYAEKELEQDRKTPLRTINSIWFPHPPGGRDETYNESLRTLLRRIYDSYGETTTKSSVLLGENII